MKVQLFKNKVSLNTIINVRCKDYKGERKARLQLTHILLLGYQLTITY